jgi:membrane associated rhomboid family serine protease
MAAALSGLMGGVVYTILTTIQMSLTDAATVLSQFPPETLQQFEDAGIDPSLFVGPNVGILCGGGCCLVGVILAAILGAIGGAVYAGLQPE